MRRRARAMLGSDDEADDVLQDVWTTLIEAPHITGGVERLGAWLMAFVRRRSIDRLRRIRVRRPAADVHETPIASADPIDAVRDRLIREEQLTSVAAALKQLPRVEKDLLVANIFEEKSLRTIAAETDTPLGTLLSRRRRAILRLRTYLRENTAPDDWDDWDRLLEVGADASDAGHH